MKFWSCRDVARMIAEGEFDEASGFRWFLAHVHLLGCRFCRRYLREVRLLSKVARYLAQGLVEGRRDAFEKRLIARLSGSL